jgi:hypothetical protein
MEASDFINGLFFLYLIGIAVAFFIYRATQTVRKNNLATASLLRLA